MSLPNLLTSLALVVLFSAILFFYFNRMFKQLDDKVNTFMDLFHGRLEDIASRTLMNGGGRGQSTQNTINLYDLNEESIQTPHIQADGKIVVSDDSESESESESDSDSEREGESDGESSEEGEGEGEGEEQVQLVKNEEGDNEEGDNEDVTKQMVEELLLSNVGIEDVEDLQVDPDVKVIKSLEKVEDETVGEISKKEDDVVTDDEDDEDDSLDDDESESESESEDEVNAEENAEKEAEIKKLKAMTTKQLKSLAKERKLKKYKSLTKTKLVELLVSK